MGHTFDRVLLARHFALCAGAVAAYILRSELQIGYTALSIVALSAALNFAAYVFRTRPGLAQICFVASPIIGVGGWASLIAVTGGVTSPFIAGLWLEIVLSAMAMEATGIVVVTSGSLVALWVQQWFVGIADERAVTAIFLQSGFMGGMGIATFLVTRRWLRAQGNLSERHAELAGRLGSLAQQLEDERVLSQMGENVARLAHGLKNAVHSLRGFVSLIEPRLDAKDDRAALDGLRAAIDDLETLARFTLEVPEAANADAAREKNETAFAGIARALREVEVAHPGVAWETISEGGDRKLPLRDEEFHEILLILLGNSAEAMRGQGKASIATVTTEREFQISIHDEGVGFSPDSIPSLFKRGFTTKTEGNGYGLFLARRILEQYGGALHIKPGEARGATVELHIPIDSNHSAEGASTAVN